MTDQLHEKLILDGEKNSIEFPPSLPRKNDSRIMHRNIENCDSDIFCSTACWRQYVGTWEIKDNKFYLVGLEGRFKLLSDMPVLADWFTGTLIVPTNEMFDLEPMRFGSSYGHKKHIKIEKGVVMKCELKI